jgi:EAL domain-containing protein (putative c-di-GMP-specific phosphodiesterase class I)
VASQAVIGAVSVLAQRLEVDVVFEGLERPEQLESLKPWGVHLVQGYLFGAPMPHDKIRERLLSNPALRVA